MPPLRRADLLTDSPRFGHPFLAWFVEEWTGKEGGDHVVILVLSAAEVAETAPESRAPLGSRRRAASEAVHPHRRHKIAREIFPGLVEEEALAELAWRFHSLEEPQGLVGHHVVPLLLAELEGDVGAESALVFFFPGRRKEVQGLGRVQRTAEARPLVCGAWV